MAFHLACCFERLKRSGLFGDVFIDDPFDPEGSASVKLTESEWWSSTGRRCLGILCTGHATSSRISQPLGSTHFLPLVHTLKRVLMTSSKSSFRGHVGDAEPPRFLGRHAIILPLDFAARLASDKADYDSLNRHSASHAVAEHD